jgi:hypothetical protein
MEPTVGCGFADGARVAKQQRYLSAINEPAEPITALVVCLQPVDASRRINIAGWLVLVGQTPQLWVVGPARP